jgi:UDP-3-O-[3-hydroxymyristoyl] glucosamine N-acyltransferase
MHTLNHLAEVIRAELIGDPEAVIRRAQPFADAIEGDVTFATTPAYLARLSESRATAIIVARKVEGVACNLLIAKDPKLAFARAVQSLHATAYQPLGVSEDLVVGEGSSLGEDLSIYPRVTIGRESIIGDRVTLYPGVVIGNNCNVGDDTVIHPNVAIYDDTRIGSRVIIHAGTVIGADGFSFVPDEKGRQTKLLQMGCVRIEDDCEIGANCAIDRAGFGETILKRGVKLDNFIQVGHNTVLGEDTVVAAMSGFSGGTRVGRGCVIAGQAGTAQHVEVGDGAIIAAKAAVMKNVRAGAMVGGIPARAYKAWRRSQVLYSRLPEIVERLKRLEKLVGQKERS